MSEQHKIRILHIAQAAGGVDRYIQMLLKYLNHDRFENIIVCSYDFREEDYKDLVIAFEQIDMHRAIGIYDLKVTILIRKLIKKYKPDIVYAHSSKAGAIVRMADIGIKNKCIYNPHGLAFNMQGSKNKQFVYTIMEKIMAPFCIKIVCISEAEKKSALDKKICSEKKLTVIFNGVDIDDYIRFKHKGVLRSDIGIPEDAFIVGMVGRLSVQKAPDIFVKMAIRIKKYIPNAHFILVGDGDMRKDIEEYAEKHKLLDSMHIIGWVNNPFSYIELFDVAVLLSRWEGFGLVIPEYMMCKKPVVATAVDAIPNIITDHVNGLLVPMNDPAAACSAVMEIYNDFDLKNRLVVQGEKDVYEKYDAKRVSKEHDMLFMNFF